MRFMVLFLFAALIGCTASQQMEMPTEQPALLRTAPLPPLTSVSSMGGVQMYPLRIREGLRDLNTNEVTRPVKVGRKYVIYKRYEDDRTKVVQ